MAWQVLDISGHAIAISFIEPARALITGTCPQRSRVPAARTHLAVHDRKHSPSDPGTPSTGINEHHRHVPDAAHDRPGAVLRAIGLGKRHRDHAFVIARNDQACSGVSELLPNTLNPLRSRRPPTGCVRRAPYLQRGGSIFGRRDASRQHDETP